MPSTDLIFSNHDEHRAWLRDQSKLPLGFKVGTATFNFTPQEAPKPAAMTLTLISLDEPSADFGAVFTRNAFPGAPVIIGRQRLVEPSLGALVINNKISNVCAPDGVETSEEICGGSAKLLGLKSNQIFPSSTGIIGWRLPADAMIAALPEAKTALQSASILPAAEGIVTTDLYPKVRSVSIGGGRIVGIAKGAGMVEPNLATMLVYLLTDIAIPRDELRAELTRAVNKSFNRISIDSDTSTSDTVAVISSGRIQDVALAEFRKGLEQVCQDLAEDVVRNGEGVRHVMRVSVRSAPDVRFATDLGRAVVNAPLFKCAIAGNDPNVGRLVQAIGRFVGNSAQLVDVGSMSLSIGGIEIFGGGVFKLDPQKEDALQSHLQSAQLYESKPTEDGVFLPPIDYPAHERCVEIDIQMGDGTAEAIVLGGDLTHEYVTENADYRS
ncbi:bifunctional ornithine acetyltransferase/N-acetylglutamate synthase [Opitutaceae bacterium]|nr:bifunctional ornithine acetyltransferase/N-acetylglutamate synthase [Opitutaceae bacterium]